MNKNLYLYIGYSESDFEHGLFLHPQHVVEIRIRFPDIERIKFSTTLYPHYYVRDLSDRLYLTLLANCDSIGIRYYVRKNWVLFPKNIGVDIKLHQWGRVRDFIENVVEKYETFSKTEPCCYENLIINDKDLEWTCNDIYEIAKETNSSPTNLYYVAEGVYPVSSNYLLSANENFEGGRIDPQTQSLCILTSCCFVQDAACCCRSNDSYQ